MAIHPVITFARVVLLLAVIASLVGCEREPKHPAAPTLEAALEALRYGDDAGLKRVHIEATKASVYCVEEPMQRLWDKAGDVADGGRCERLDEISNEEIDSAPDELRFLLQVVRFRCEKPKAACEDYGERTLSDALETSELSQASITGWKVQKFLGDDGSAVAYVDVQTEVGVIPRAVKLRKVGEVWLVVSGLLSGDES